jgi:HSP20 family protein
LIRVNDTGDRPAQAAGSHPMEVVMVEKAQTGLWPAMFDPFRQLSSRLAEWVAPASEASAGSDSYRIAVELPGVDEKDVELTLDDGVLTLKGEKKTQTEEKGETWFFSERQYGAFQRSFRLPPDADPAAVGASMKGGVLTVSVGKRKAGDAGGARKVAITSG